MRLLNPDFDLDLFFTSLNKAEQSALLLDYDGTLSPFKAERDQALPYAGIRERLNKLLHLQQTRLVIVSGRGIEEILSLLSLEDSPEIFGLHGGERLHADGRVQTTEIPERVLVGLTEADQWADKNIPTANYERKAISRAFHWRSLTDKEAAAIRAIVLKRWSESCADYGLVLDEFDGGLELKAAGIDKGQAVRLVLGELGKGAVVAYLGDDLTDEDAFAALGNSGLKVLVRPENRPTMADLWLKPPGELIAFLDRWLQSINQ
jgi:trehalose 6-phosphate phosphatase